MYIFSHAESRYGVYRGVIAAIYLRTSHLHYLFLIPVFTLVRIIPFSSTITMRAARFGDARFYLDRERMGAVVACL